MFIFPPTYNTIRFKLTVAIATVVIVYTFILLAYFRYRYKSSILASATQNAQSMAREYAQTISGEIDNAFDISRTLAQTLSSVQHAENKSDLSRKDVNMILKTVLEANPSLLGIYTAWEPNAFDGQDVQYVGMEGNHPEGSFVPYWAKDSQGNTIYEPLKYYRTEGKGDYYLIPRKTKKETVIDPINYKIGDRELFLMTLVVPILKNDDFLGVVGTDISTDDIQGIVNSAQIFGGKGSMVVISSNGSIVALTDTIDVIGTNASKVYPNLNYRVDTTTTIEYKNNILTIVPINFGNSDAPWYVAISVPENYLVKDIISDLIILFLVSILVLGSMIYGIRLLIVNYLSPIKKIAIVADKLSVGDLNVWDVTSNSSEVDQLNEAFRNVVEAQKKITDVCVAIAAGDYSKSADVKGEHDILAKSVNQMVDNLKQNTSEEAIRKWTNEGFTSFAELLRTESDLTNLCKSALTFLINYTSSNQGGIFIVNDTNHDDLYLELAACYAYNRTKFIHKKIKPGEGLLGQTYLERDTIFLTEIPQEYLNIRSGLGDATPRCLIIIPLINNEKIEGVMEMASFKVFESYQIEFLEKCAISLASVITNTRINELTSKLLSEAQSQAEQMKVQEEEMRQNMEELAATQEEMKRKQTDYLELIDALNVKITNLETNN